MAAVPIIISRRKVESEYTKWKERAQVGRGCLTNMETKREGGSEPVWEVFFFQRGQTRAYLYADGTGRTQVQYSTRRR